MSDRTAPEVPRAALVALTVLAVARAGGLLLIAEGFARLIVDTGTGQPAVGAALAAAGLVVRALAGWGSAFAGRRAAAAAKLAHRGTLARGVVDRDLDAGSVAVVATRGLDALDAYYTSVVPAAIAAIVLPLGITARVLLADPLSALILALTLPLVPVFMVLIGMHSRDRVEAAHDALTRLADHIAELARGLPVLVGLGRDREQAERLAVIQQNHSARTHRVLGTAFLSALALELVATLSVAVVAVVLGLRLLSGDVGLFEALVVLLLAPECFTAVRELGSAHHAAEDGRVALTRVRELLAAPSRVDRRRAAETLTVDRFGVRHPGRRGSAVDDVTFTARRGEIVALTGASGAGKSTVLAALAGTLPADATVTGILTAPRQVAWVPQDPRCAAETVRAELERYAGDADVDGVLGELGLRGVAELPPEVLSPGELRRVAVARALLRVDSGARLLLLDEPTAHLDPVAAGAVRAAIAARAPRVITVLVSHDPATLALADRAVALDATAPESRSVPAPGTLPDAIVRRPASVPPGGVRLALAAVLRPAPWLWVGAVLLGLLATGMGLALTAVSAWLIVRASEQPAVMYLLVAIVGVRFFGIGRAVARYAERLVTHRAAFRAVDDLRLRLWQGMAARGAGSRELLEGGRAVDHLVGTAAEVRDLLPRTVPPVAIGILAAGGVVLTVSLVAPEAAGLVGAGLLLALVLPAGVAFLAGRRAEADRVRASSALLRSFAAVGRAASDLRANGVADATVAELDRRSRSAAAAERRSGTTAEAGMQLAPLLAGATAVAATALLVVGGAPAATVAVVALIVYASGDALAAAVAGGHRIPGLIAALAPLGRLLAPSSRAARGSGRPGRRIEDLVFDEVSVGWSPDTSVATGIAGRVRRGEVLVIEGPSGSGKSTLLTTLLGDLDVRAGRIEVDGVELAELDPAAWRARVVWCPQEAHVFDSTLRGNLLIGRPRDNAADEAELDAVLHRVGLGAMVAALESGIDGRVGPGGRWLSGGERQRLAVARALLSDADVVLLDEPTAHLDGPTADALMGDLRAALSDRIVVLVTHRMQDRRDGDPVVRLGDTSPRVLEAVA
ncbi:thiol reductant ABC exporter subunit CydC [Pseudolysinimonas yzui]|uniref:Thiol reductant ABC exporter subunit CydC n=1 Tax=Pseudolysinimonas yzui TaxID=2708254 RepID=A0A8J3GS90_9MICO|nr:thiol reductant ABC exporter subunit CydC [Pseudolysinimonas yzui]GHF24578.1 thiol reductant ABC exporter subunit CydC [Pseudolysinimonas yzui]